jgi:hypothetical protein
MILAQPVITKILLEEDLETLEKLSYMLEQFIDTQPYDPDYFTDRTKTGFQRIAKTLSDRVDQRSIDYTGGKYIIMAKGRRKISLGFKREPDLFIGEECGLNFIEACRSFFSFGSYYSSYNQKRNTLCGRMLFGLPVNVVSNYESGIKRTNDGYTVWFKIMGQTYNMASEKVRANSELQCKTLNRAFENLMTLKKTKP